MDAQLQAGNSSHWRSWLTDVRLWISVGTLLAYYVMLRLWEGAPLPEWPYRLMAGQTALISASLCMILGMWFFHRRPWATYLLLHLFAFGFGAAVFWTWQSQPAGPSGVLGDAWFQVAMVRKFQSSLGNQDFAYKGLHAFYPSLYPWVVGQMAALTKTPTLAAVKYGFYWAALLLPLVGFALWRKLLPPIAALVVMVLTTALSVEFFTFKTYEVASLLIFLPWALHFVAGIRLQDREGAWSWQSEPLQGRAWLWGGLIGGLLFMTFYYYFFLFIVWIPIQLLVERRLGSNFSWRMRAFPLLKMLGVMLLVSAVYWLPLLWDLMRWGMHSYQNRWFQPHMLELPFDILGNWKALLGLLALVVLAPKHALARTMLSMCVATLAFILLGHLGVYGDFPILHVRMVALADLLLHIGLILGLLALLARFRERIPQAWEWAVALGLVTVLSVQIAQHDQQEAQSERARLALLVDQPAITTFKEFNQAADGKVFLTNRLNLLAWRPIYLFICPNAHYSHPAARYRERLKMLALLSDCHDSAFMAWMLRHNRYDAVDYVLLDSNRLNLYDDNFPHLPNHIELPLQFDDAVFAGPDFRQDSIFQELWAVQDVPRERWQQFDRGQLRLAALFGDVPEAAAAIPAAELEALQAEIRIRTWDYVAWRRAFAGRWLR